MGKKIKTIEISKMPEVMRIVEEVRKTKTARILSRKRKLVAILRPFKRAPKRAKRTITKADREAFLSSAGSWKDVDTDELIKNIYESRRISSRPLVQL